MMLPPLRRTTITFLQQLLSGEKLFVDISKATIRQVPKWPELGLKRVMALLKHTPLNNYLPDNFKHVVHEFFWTVAFSIVPTEAAAVVEQVRSSRKVLSPFLQGRDIQIKPELLEKLVAYRSLKGKSYTC